MFDHAIFEDMPVKTYMRLVLRCISGGLKIEDNECKIT